MCEFEKFIKSQGFSGDFKRGLNGQYKSDLLHFMEKAFLHQQTIINDLKAQLECCRKENVVLLGKAGELQGKFDEVCDLLDRAEVDHRHLLTKYQSTKAMEMSSSKILSRIDQILNDLSESVKDFKEMDLYDKGYRVAVVCVIGDLEKALRGADD